MEPEEFVTVIEKSILQEMMDEYRTAGYSLLGQKQWPDMFSLLKELNEEQSKLFFNQIQQTIIDTISTFLGVLDGSTILGNFKEEFHLTYADDKHELNGDLQDLFLADIQESRK